MKILIAGLPGSGKTTQAKILSSKLGIPLISTGIILRDLVKKGGRIGKQISQILDTGQFVDDNLVRDLIKKRLAKKDCQNGFITDGYPRSLEQLHLYNPGFSHVIYLRVSEVNVAKRLLGRGRKDDRPEIIEERFEVYHAETEPLIEYFKKKAILTTVDGTRSINEVAKRIEEVVSGQN